MSKDMKEKSRSTLETLRQKREDLQNWAEKFKNSSGDAWEETKQGFSRAWRDFQRSLEDTEDKSEKETRI
jgi:gas vesicle protein